MSAEWQSVPTSMWKAWSDAFDQSGNLSVEVLSLCPLCNQKGLRRYYGATKGPFISWKGKDYLGKGSFWEWCNHCHTYEHGSCLIPVSWVDCAPSLPIKEHNLTHTPNRLAAAIEAWLEQGLP